MANLLDFEAKQSREKAGQVMEKIMKNTAEEKKVSFIMHKSQCIYMFHFFQISVVIEFVIGKVQETIQHMINMYQPSLLIVGTRGLSEFKGMLLGSVSKYCLQHSPVPVAVVRPEDKKVKKSSVQRLSGLMRLGSGSIPTMSSFTNVTDETEGSRDSSLFNRLSLKHRSRSTSPAPR